MNWTALLMVAGLTSVALGTNLSGTLISGNPMRRPQNPVVLIFVRNFGLLAMVVGLLRGFWLAGWWWLLLLIGVIAAIGILWPPLSRGSPFAAIVLTIAGAAIMAWA